MCACICVYVNVYRYELYVCDCMCICHMYHYVSFGIHPSLFPPPSLLLPLPALLLPLPAALIASPLPIQFPTTPHHHPYLLSSSLFCIPLPSSASRTWSPSSLIHPLASYALPLPLPPRALMPSPQCSSPPPHYPTNLHCLCPTTRFPQLCVICVCPGSSPAPASSY